MARKAKHEKPNTAVIYARFSSHNQREVSIDQQVKACTDFAKRKELEIVGVYSDAAISGKETDNRPQFQRMLADAQDHKFGYVIAWKSNRIARNMVKAMETEAMLRVLGIDCLYVEEDFDNTAAGRFALRNMMNVNQFYIENMAEDIIRGMNDNAQKCIVNGPVPLGYQRGSDGKYEINTEEAEVVRSIFDKFLAGAPFADIAYELNARGVKTKSGGEWNKGSFHRMLRNERYIGTYIFGETVIENGIPPIISKEIFYKVQQKLKMKQTNSRRRSPASYILTGKLFCGHCGSPMVGVSGTSKSGALHCYYVCQARLKEKTCKKKNVPKEWIEDRVIDSIRQYIMKDEVLDWLIDGFGDFKKQLEAESSVTIAEKELEEVSRSVKNLLAAIEQGIITDTTKERLLELERRKQSLEMEITLSKQALMDVDEDMIRFWLEEWRKGDYDDLEFRKQLIDIFLNAVYLYDDKLRILFNYSDRNSEVAMSLEEIDEIEVTADACVRIDAPKLHQMSRYEHRVTLYRVGGIFVLEVPI
jgi:DNA invertase Pin-like site-specific DNA recombinase